MNIFRLFIPCCLSLLAGCCQNPSLIKAEDVESLTFYTTLRDFETTQAIRSVDELLEWNQDSLNGGILCRDSVVSDRLAIQTFVKLVNELKSSKEDSYDLRTAVAIHFKNKSTRYIGFGEYCGICYEGKTMQDHDRLFQFLEDSIYSRHCRSYWWGSWVRAVQSGEFDFVDDELTGVKAYTEVKVDNPPLFNGDDNGFYKEFHRVAVIPHMNGDTTLRKVEVQFIINKEGKLIGPRIRGKREDQLNDEEIQVIEKIKSIQNWRPGTYEGEPVDVFLTRFLSY